MLRTILSFSFTALGFAAAAQADTPTARPRADASFTRIDFRRDRRIVQQRQAFPGSQSDDRATAAEERYYTGLSKSEQQVLHEQNRRRAAEDDRLAWEEWQEEHHHQDEHDQHWNENDDRGMSDESEWNQE